MRTIVFITGAQTVRAIPAHLGEPTAPARGPPLWGSPAARAGGGDPHAQPALEYEFDQRLAW